MDTSLIDVAATEAVPAPFWFIQFFKVFVAIFKISSHVDALRPWLEFESSFTSAICHGFNTTMVFKPTSVKNHGLDAQSYGPFSCNTANQLSLLGLIHTFHLGLDFSIQCRNRG